MYVSLGSLKLKKGNTNNKYSHGLRNSSTKHKDQKILILMRARAFLVFVLNPVFVVVLRL